MNRLPDIVVLDFCIWLSEHTKPNNSTNGMSFLDALSDDQLSSYAQSYLRQRRFDNKHGNFPFRSMIEGFLSSEEFRMLEDDSLWKYHWYLVQDRMREMYKNKDKERFIADHAFYLIEEAFHHYLYSFFDQAKEMNINLKYISSHHLAEYTKYYLQDCMQSSDNELKKPFVMNLMIKSHHEVANEINFLEWVIQTEHSKSSFKCMPPEVFNKLLDEYEKDTGKDEKEISKLREDYYQIGWTTIFKRIQCWFRLQGNRPERDLAYVMERYLSRRAKFNCIILPLADKKNRKLFNTLITDQWKNLNDLSGDALDIYYSETDIGKTGYDIAMRLQALPDSIRKTAPCIIVWKETIAESKSISIDGLDTDQIRNTIQTIVQQIEEGKELVSIIEEAKKTVKQQQELNHGVTNQYIGGIGNIVGDNVTTKNTIVVGNSNKVSNNDYTQINKEFINEVDAAISAIKDSSEVDEESKKQLISIMEDAKNAENENSNEKRESAKKAFGYVKGFLTKAAPTLISTLANLTKIASFFGL